MVKSWHRKHLRVNRVCSLEHNIERINILIENRQYVEIGISIRRNNHIAVVTIHFSVLILIF